MDSKSKFTISLLIVTLVASSLLSVQAYVVDSIAKPSVPEFSVQLVSHPYDVPAKTTTTVDQYTGKETITTIPGYHVENKSIEVTIKNQPFTSSTITNTTLHSPEGIYTDTIDRTTGLFYGVQVKGHYGQEQDWKAAYSGQFDFTTGTGRKPDAQSGSGIYVINLKAEEYPSDATLDFRVKAIAGFYVGYGSIIIKGYNFYGQESAWSSIQQLTLGNPQTPTPAPTATPTPIVTPTLPPASTQSPIATPIQPNPPTETNFTLSWEQGALIVCVAVIAALIIALVVSRRKKA